MRLKNRGGGWEIFLQKIAREGGGLRPFYGRGSDLPGLSTSVGLVIGRRRRQFFMCCDLVCQIHAWFRRDATVPACTDIVRGHRDVRRISPAPPPRYCPSSPQCDILRLAFLGLSSFMDKGYEVLLWSTSLLDSLETGPLSRTPHGWRRSHHQHIIRTKYVFVVPVLASSHN